MNDEEWMYLFVERIGMICGCADPSDEEIIAAARDVDRIMAMYQ